MPILSFGFTRAAALGADLDEFADAVLIDGDERVDLDDLRVEVVAEDGRGIVAREAETGLRQVVGAEREELGARCRRRDLGGPQRRARQLDHGADLVGQLGAGFLLRRRRQPCG